MARRTFEKFFLDYMAEAMGQAIAVLITEDAISVTIDDRQRLSAMHETGSFLVTCYFTSKQQSDEAMEAAAIAVDNLPDVHPFIMKTGQIAQDVILEKAPRKWRYTGAFEVRWHTKETY